MDGPNPLSDGHTNRRVGREAFVGAPESEMLFCGIAVGHPDPAAPINTLRTERMPLEQFATFL